jgi:DNA-binding beta-propeller fold protein YncE
VFVDQTEEASVVTAIGVKSGNISVINNEENAFGDIIMGVQLNETGTKLYCLSGSQTYSIKVYDFATDKITTIKDNILLESDLYYYNGYLYYCDVVDEYEAVVRLNVSNGEIELLHKGSQFTVSPDGNKIAVIAEHYETAVCDLRVIDITKNAWDTVFEDVVTTEFFFSSDSKTLYFALETGDDEFYYQLMKYDLETMKAEGIAQAINSVFYASNKPNEIIVSVMYNDETGSRPATYIADFDQMIIGETQE